MATFDRHSCAKVYLLAETAKAARAFAAQAQLPDAVIVKQVEDLPRSQMTVILIGRYWKHVDYPLLFGIGGLFYDFKAMLFYDAEVILPERKSDERGRNPRSGGRLAGM